MSCNVTTVESFNDCDVRGALSVEEAEIGMSLEMVGGPFTEIYDSRVEVGGATAEVEAITRTACEECDLCRADQGCSTCSESCLPCADDCASCTETLSFVVPEQAPFGETAVILFNRYGTTSPLPITVLGSFDSDTGALDSDLTDTGTFDTDPPSPVP